MHFQGVSGVFLRGFMEFRVPRDFREFLKGGPYGSFREVHQILKGFQVSFRGL